MVHNSDPKYRYQGRKFPHDLSHNLMFTSSCGQLIPVLTDFLYPGDHVEIASNLFTRLAEVETAAFTKMREHIEYFFVPINHIISTFPQFIYGVGKNVSVLTTDPNTIATQVGVPILEPSTDYNAMITGKFDLFNQSVSGDAKRLLDMLEYSGAPDYNVLGVNGMGVNVLRICAYHKIFFDHYALQDRTIIDNSLYNLDDCLPNMPYIPFGTPSLRDASKFFSIHYRPFQHDYFSDMKVSPVETPSFAKNATSSLSANVNNWLSNRSNFKALNPQSVHNSDDASTVGFYDTSTSVSLYSLTSANIRALFAVDKLLEITRRSKKDYAHQTMAHFGSNVPEGISGSVYRLGSITQDLTIQDVDAGANSVYFDSQNNQAVPTSFLGQQGGKGVTMEKNLRPVKFTAPCHGILMGIYSCEPLVNYPDTMISRQNSYALREDFFTPEYDHLGMQPIFGYEMYAAYPSLRTNVYGWQYRYQESKQKFNRITTGFNTAGLSSWNTVRSTSQFFSNQEFAFYIPPTYLNSIMLVQYDNDDFGTDPLRHSLDFYYMKSSVMSNYSLPQLSGNV